MAPLSTEDDMLKLIEEESLPDALQTPYPFADPTKGVFCSRTLNLKSIQVTGARGGQTPFSVWSEKRCR